MINMPSYQFFARHIIDSYRRKGHYLAKLDPLNLEVLKTRQELGLSFDDFGCNFPDSLSRDLIEWLENVYSASIGVEFDHINNLEEKSWLYDQMETGRILFSNDEKIKFLCDLSETKFFEQYLHKKFPGSKRFSIEGSEAFIIALDYAITSMTDAKHILVGMTHRGRLSAVTKVFGKSYGEIFLSFLHPEITSLSGDVLYHLGHASTRNIKGRDVYVELLNNPSHLESINVVLAGKVRALQDMSDHADRKDIVGILVHGDSAFCGQGVVAEYFAMSSLKPYNIGGVVHFVINNQLGFTANSSDSRMSRYSTEFAKIANIPILHVNGDDIESVIFATKLAVSYKKKFARDVVIEIMCYRKYGHSEWDEPGYTQNLMYNVINQKKSVISLYEDILIKENIIEDDYLTKFESSFKRIVDDEYELSKNYCQTSDESTHVDNRDLVTTGVSNGKLLSLGLKLCKVPEHFALHPKLEKLFESRKKHLNESREIDFILAEQLSFATLLDEGFRLRLTGQDSQRGTFSQRHGVLYSVVDNSRYVPLNNLSGGQGFFDIANSNLSEYGALGFEYGYSLVSAKNLTIWEAQFGDFVNGAQIIFDQFISSAEAKWGQSSRLVIFLPHGFDGQGPEHSSCRLERLLQLSAQNNMCIAYPSTPASFFHLLRRHAHSAKTPLIIMTPKSLLRHKLCKSSFEDIAPGREFKSVLADRLEYGNIGRVVLCTGKIYYDLTEKMKLRNISSIAIIRLEQLYPFPMRELIDILQKYVQLTELVWCQEEPKNMGAWSFVKPFLDDLLKKIAPTDIVSHYIGREASSSPATGSMHRHIKERDTLVSNALSI